MDDSKNLDDNEIGSLIDQLQNTTILAKNNEKIEDPLKKEEIETFVIAKAGELVRESLDFMKSMKEYVASAPNGEDITAIASLISATSNTLETLNKLVVTDKKAETIIKVKQMDIQSRKELADSAQPVQMLLTREELFKRLLSDRPITTDVIDITSKPA